MSTILLSILVSYACAWIIRRHGLTVCVLSYQARNQSKETLEKYFRKYSLEKLEEDLHNFVDDKKQSFQTPFLDQVRGFCLIAASQAHHGLLIYPVLFWQMVSLKLQISPIAYSTVDTLSQVAVRGRLNVVPATERMVHWEFWYLWNHNWQQRLLKLSV